jgi:hypothetical protein
MKHTILSTAFSYTKDKHPKQWVEKATILGNINNQRATLTIATCGVLVLEATSSIHT